MRRRIITSSAKKDLSLDYVIIDAGEPYSIMTDRETLDVAEYKKAVSKL